MGPLPGGSPGPNANIPAPWRLVIILAGILAIIAIGALIRHTLQLFDEESSKGIEQWSIEWNKEHQP